MKDSARSASAVGLVGGGAAAAFALAACCAIPLLLAGIGLGAGWLAPLVAATQPVAGVLTAASLAALVTGVVIAWRAPTRCGMDSLCARPAFRWGLTAAAAVGGVLLLLSKIYG